MSEALRQLDDAALVARANDALRTENYDTLIAALELLVERHPEVPALRQRLSVACNNRGSRHARGGAMRAAEADVDRALALDPDNAEALYNRARFFAAARHWQRALVSYRRLRSLRPHDAEIALDAAEAAALVGEPGAIEQLEAALAQVEGDPSIDAARRASALATLGRSEVALAALARADLSASPRLAAEPGDRLREGPDWRAARRAYALAAAAGGPTLQPPSLRAAIGAQLALPLVYRDPADLAQARTSFLEGLEALCERFDSARLSSVQPALEQLAWTNQMLAYQGADDRMPASRYGDWLTGAARQFAPRLAQTLSYRPARMPRIGLISSGFYRSVIGNYFGGWISGLTAAGLAPTVFLVDTPADEATRRMTATAAATVALSGSIESMAEAVREARIDVLVYPEIGIDPRCQVLAALRLAPRQLAAWGHPETSGLPTLDGYLSCAAMEAEGAAAHYREPLLLLPDAGTAFVDPGEPPVLSRADFGLPERANLYLVPHVPPKLHPDCDAVFGAIAARDPNALLLTFRFDRPAVRDAIAVRMHSALAGAGADPDRQWRELPYLPRERFLGLCALADVMIDTLHWSGGANTVDALRCRLPVVTCAGPLMRGRQTLGMLRMLGLDTNLACQDAAELTERAVAVATDRDLRRSLGAAISDAVPALFDGQSALTALAEHLRAQLDAR